MESKEFFDIAQGLEEYLTQLFQSVDGEYYKPLTGATFCGCEVCQLRETLAFLTKYYNIEEKDQPNE